MAPDGSMRLIMGSTNYVDWTEVLDSKVDPWGHVHPFDQRNPKPVWTAAMSSNNPSWLPSWPDIRFTLNNGGSHIVHTSYQWDPVTKGLAPLTDGEQFNVLIHIPNPNNPKQIIYQPLAGAKPIPELAAIADLEIVPYLDMGLQPKKFERLHNITPTQPDPCKEVRIGSSEKNPTLRVTPPKVGRPILRQQLRSFGKMAFSTGAVMGASVIEGEILGRNPDAVESYGAMDDAREYARNVLQTGYHSDGRKATWFERYIVPYMVITGPLMAF